MRTLVVHTGGIGDFLLACPAIAKLDGTVELLGRVERLMLAVEAGIAQAAHDIESTDFHTLLTTPSDRLKAFLTPFDRAVVWMRDADGRLGRSLRSTGIEHVELFSGLPDADWTGHASEYYANCLHVAPDPEFQLQFEPNQESRDVIFHPGSGSPSKNWPLEQFHALAEMLNRAGHRVEWCLGPAELERLPEAPSLKPALDYRSLIELAPTLAGARLYVGNDSGITHLAACVGCPTMAIFGPTDPRVWAPLGAHVRITHDAEWPDAEIVYPHCQELLSSAQ